MIFPIFTLVAFLAVPVHSVDWNVNVGQNDELAFNPTSLTGVSSGDVVVFSFNPPIHSATQSSFSTPCIASAGGFDTGLVSVSDPSNPTVMNWTVPEGDGPWWLFCKQTGHCARGMVFAVNPTTSETYDAFKDLAQGITPPSASSSSSAGPVSTATTSSGTGSSVSSTSTSAPPTQSNTTPATDSITSSTTNLSPSPSITTSTVANPSPTNNAAVSLGLGSPLAFGLLFSVLISTML